MSPSALQFLATLMLLLISASSVFAQEVRVETLTEGSGPAVTAEYEYSSMVTLYIEHSDGSKTPSGWSTRESDGAKVDNPFKFQPGVNLIEGWTEGVLKMKEGEHALLHIPSAKGYGTRPMGQPGGSFYIPANSDLLFDIEILGKAESPDL